MQMYLPSVSNCATLLAMHFKSYSSYLPSQKFHSKYWLFLSKFANFRHPISTSQFLENIITYSLLTLGLWQIQPKQSKTLTHRIEFN